MTTQRNSQDIRGVYFEALAVSSASASASNASAFRKSASACPLSLSASARSLSGSGTGRLTTVVFQRIVTSVLFGLGLKEGINGLVRVFDYHPFCLRSTLALRGFCLRHRMLLSPRFSKWGRPPAGDRTRTPGMGPR